MKTITDEKFLKLVNSGTTLKGPEKRYVESMIEAHQKQISLRTAIGLVVSSTKQRVPYLSEGVSL
jgi:hypothetical protein